MISHFFNTIIYDDKYRITFMRFGELLFGAVIGAMLTLPTSLWHKILISLIVSLLIIILSFFWYIFQEKDPKKLDIIGFIKNSDSEVAISWCYTMRNLLSHAGYIKYKTEIAEYVYDLIEKNHIDDSRVIYDTETPCGTIKATILIDDFGWYSYELSLKNSDKCIEMIDKGIALAKKINDNYLVFRGCRHKSNLYINRGRIEPENQSRIAIKLRELKEELSGILDPTYEHKIVELNSYIDIYIYVFTNEYDRALSLARSTMDLVSDNEVSAKLNEAIGFIYYSLKEYENAIIYFDFAMKAAHALRPARYLSLAIYYFVSKEAFFTEQYSKYTKSFNRVGRQRELSYAKEIFTEAKRIAITRDSNKLDDLIVSYNSLKKSICRK